MPFIILSMVLVIIVALFALQNAAVVPVTFLFYQHEASLVIVILGSTFLGIVLSASVSMYIRFKNFWQTRGQSDSVKDLQDENFLLKRKVEALEAQLLEEQNKNKNQNGQVQPL